MRGSFYVKFLFRLGSRWHRFYALKSPFDYCRLTCWGIWRNFELCDVQGMNRSFVSVILGGFGVEDGDQTKEVSEKPVKTGSPEDAAFILNNANSVIIVPGYGMAVAQAQHALREMCDTLKKNGVKIKYAIHPVAGRMPGHMNVLLAEASVPYDEVLELEEINSDFANTDAVFVIGANDITNPAAKTDKTSPIYGMPILDVEKSGTVLFVKGLWHQVTPSPKRVILP